MTAEEFAAGVDALLPILTILSTGAVTIVGGWLTAKYTRRNDKLKIDAEQARETARLAHEEKLSARAIASAKAEAAAEAEKTRIADEEARAAKVVDRFLEVIRAVRDHDPQRGDESDFASYFQYHWGTANEIELRREVGTLADAELRTRLNNIVVSMDDHRLAERNGSTDKTWAGWLANMGVELAQAAARGEEPSSETTESYDRFLGVFEEIAEERRESNR